jgi:hypothetical protein
MEVADMKRVSVLIALAMLLTGCGKQESVNNTSTVVKTAETTKPETPTPASTPTPATNNAERPIEFTYLGITPDKQHIHYKIKVLTAKPISQVDLGIKYTDDDGKVLEDTTLIWQNIIKSKREPIEQEKTYDVEDYMTPGTTHAEVILKRVVFEDGTYWNAQ